MKKIYFIGIGGIGMSALARYHNDSGFEVHGYDKVQTILTKKLEDEGMIIHYEEDISKIPQDLELVVYTPAIPDDHLELNWFRNNDYQLIKRAELLGQLSHNSYSICVGGTHGKTTTSSLIAYLLTEGNVGATAILGGVSKSIGSNYIKGDQGVLVTEADEYDRSFLHLDPDVAVIMSLDPDHLDIYGEFEKMKDSFFEFAHAVSPEGALIIRHDVPEKLGSRWDKLKDSKKDIVTFGGRDSDLRIENIRIGNGTYIFDYVAQDDLISGIETRMPGLHNLENLIVAIYVARKFGMSAEDIVDAIGQFQGISRRFEWIVDENDLVIIDDYAHHPTELNAVISATRSLYPSKKISGIFQPHLFSRTRDFAEEFASSLDLLDQIYLIPIYPAREIPIEGVSTEMIKEKMENNEVELVTKEELKLKLERDHIEVLLILGAGDIDAEIEELSKIVKNSIEK